MRVLPRIMIEDWEIKNLSPLAAKASYSKGRLHPDDKCDVRTDFQRDRDRIIYCKSFRRLKHKTQVFIKPEGDHYRTRLTHTLEVAQISRTIARALNLNEDLTEAIALGHDIGHSPFGHAGEAALDEVINEFDKKAHFYHSEQSLRVVDLLEKEHRGLNLTNEVRDGILKHSKGRFGTLFHQGNEENVKHMTLESEIVRISDRVAYINHDIDDAIRAGIIKEEHLPKECCSLLGKSISQRINSMVKDIIRNSFDKNHIIMGEDVAQATEKLKEFMFEKVYMNSLAKTDEDKAREVVKMLFYYYMDNTDKLPKEAVHPSLNLNNKKDAARAVCDFISGMSDRYAINMFENIIMPKGWV
ncbi:MAG: deoxyguanosinetriphosphate triphosphohydrolase [Armatimonadota bacterium]